MGLQICFSEQMSLEQTPQPVWLVDWGPKYGRPAFDLPGQMGPQAQLYRWAECLAGISAWELLLQTGMQWVKI